MDSFSLDIDLLPTNVAIYKKDGDDFIFIAFNKQAEITDKISADKLLGKRLTEVFPAAKEFGLFDMLVKVERSGKSEVLDREFYKDNRISGWRHNKIVKLEDGIVASFYSEKKIEIELKNRSLQLQKQLNEIEQQLEHQKHVFQEIMENSESISVQGYDKNHKVIYWNRASENVYRYSKDEALGKKLEELIIPPEAKEFVKNSIDNWIDNGIAIPSSELQLQDKYGNEVNVFSQHVMIKIDPQNPEMYCIDINLKKIKELQNELILEKNLLNTIFNILPDLAWLKDANGVYLKCNHIFEKFFRAKESEIVGKTDFDFVDKELAQFFKDHDLVSINADKPTINEEYLTFADSSHKGMYETIRTPMKDDNGKLIGVLGIARDIGERKRREKELKHYASHDTLTGLINRAVFIDRLHQLINQRESDKFSHSVLFIDLDKFKEINDTSGHGVGDIILQMVATRLQNITRKGDTVARLGGDEFIILLENQNREKAAKIATKVIESLSKVFIYGEDEYKINSSIGISMFPADSNSVADLIKYADRAMYRAKDAGGGRYKFYLPSSS